MKIETKSAVVLLSGGMDSCTLLHHVTRNLNYTHIHALSFLYGQKHKRELKCAQIQAETVNAAAHRVLDVSFLGKVFGGATTLVEGSQMVPDLDDIAPDARDQPSTYVPHRNMILLSLAAAYAESNEIYDVFYGAQAQDEYGYWDCTTVFLERLNHVLSLNRRAAVHVYAPFIHMRKAELLRIGLDLNVDYSTTWSCYRGEDIACGTCPTCIERLHAFHEVGVQDPIPYNTEKS